jgi:3-oxoacyl-(acyl-carrier-protein) synthase
MSVWVTGLGAVTAAGPTAADLGAALRGGGTCVTPVSALEDRLAGVVQDGWIRPGGSRLDREGQLFLQAAEEAWRSAGLDESPPASPPRVSVLEGTSIGPIADVVTLARTGERTTRPTNLVRFMPGAGGCTFAIHRGSEGPVLMISAGSASSAYAIGQASGMIERGEADVVVAGGAESPLQEEIVAAFVNAGILAPPGEPCRPLDGARKGPVLGEGAGVLILESEKHARARGAPRLATVDGFGSMTRGVSLVRPHEDGRGIGRAVDGALRSAHLDRVGWIALHGTATPVNDWAEILGLENVLRHHLARTPVTALKATVGHCLGAGAALEAVGAVLALRDGFIPRISTLRTVDPALPRCDAVKDVRDATSTSVLLLAESFGGRSAALVLGAGSVGRSGPRAAPGVAA